MSKKKKKIESVGFIIDGNRRWAVENNMKKTDGHRYGLSTLLKTIQWVKEENISNMVFYIFSTENWNRKKMKLNY